MVVIEGVRDEAWIDRVRRLYFAPPGGGPLSAEHERALAIGEAQDRAGREMLDEIHLMLRHLCTRIG